MNFSPHKEMDLAKICISKMVYWKPVVTKKRNGGPPSWSQIYNHFYKLCCHVTNKHMDKEIIKSVTRAEGELMSAGRLRLRTHEGNR